MFLLVLLLGIVDVGRAIVANISVRDAVQDGASYFAYTENATAADVEARVRVAVSSPDVGSPSRRRRRLLRDLIRVTSSMDHGSGSMPPTT